ncbi:glycerate kinase type-2 family protein [Silvibacterium sp.]|uniref:glycerate kinase type-2 family protein n=1 Tax=Silvibacterium sp. TaxID=1964179 RepID=UPI0039E6CD8D
MTSAVPLDKLHDDAQAIFTQALKACDVPTAFDRHLRFEGRMLYRNAESGTSQAPISLENCKRVLIIALGKAALPMLQTTIERLPSRLSYRGVCVAPSIPRKRNWRIHYYEGGHPLPTEGSFAAARDALKQLRHARKDTFVIFLVSGGGSAMMELPLDPRISLDDAIAFHETLVASGATITEINTIRKHFSAVKAGRLAIAATESPKLTLLLADVPLRDLGSVASSPTLPDHSTRAECFSLLERYHLLEKFPQSVREYFESLDPAASPENPESHPAFSNAQVETLLSNHDFLEAAVQHARSLGYPVVVDNSCDDWDYHAASHYLLERFQQLQEAQPHLCLLSSGEVTVRLDGPSGCGGRNQQFALDAALQLASSPKKNLAVLSAGSDGIDGNSPAAGAIADPTTVERARSYGFDPDASLAHFDSCTLFTALGDTVVTGPTGNNLRDLRILLARNEVSR